MVSECKNQIQQAIELLKTSKVDTSVKWLFNNFNFQCEGIDANKKQNLSESMIDELKIGEIWKQINLGYDDKKIQIILSDNVKCYTEDGDIYEYCLLFIIYNNICVLQETMNVEYDDYGDEHYELFFNIFTLKKFKNGQWMNDLLQLVARFQAAESNREKNEEEKKLKAIALNIDLNSLD